MGGTTGKAQRVARAGACSESARQVDWGSAARVAALLAEEAEEEAVELVAEGSEAAQEEAEKVAAGSVAEDSERRRRCRGWSQCVRRE